MENTIWCKIASLWVNLRSSDEIIRTEETAQSIFKESMSCRQLEKSFYEELMDGLDEEDDDDGY